MIKDKATSVQLKQQTSVTLILCMQSVKESPCTQVILGVRLLLWKATPMSAHFCCSLLVSTHHRRTLGTTYKDKDGRTCSWLIGSKVFLKASLEWQKVILTLKLIFFVFWVLNVEKMWTFKTSWQVWFEQPRFTCRLTVHGSHDVIIVAAQPLLQVFWLDPLKLGGWFGEKNSSPSITRRREHVEARLFLKARGYC